MDVQIRRAADRGQFDHGWLKTAHTFSFADYQDPDHMGFSVLRVINEDFVSPGRGFGMHPHADMEIVTYVVEGELVHRDSMGNGSLIKPGDVQRMSAGTGVTHSEFNASKSQRVHLIQIWILPDKRGYQPSYEQKTFTAQERANKLRVVVSPDGRDGSLTIHQNASLAVSRLGGGSRIEHTLGTQRSAWVQVVRGMVEIGGKRLDPGDGAAIRGDGTLTIAGIEDAELLVFDLPRGS